MKKIKILAAISAIILSVSCSVEKIHYVPTHDISWKENNPIRVNKNSNVSQDDFKKVNTKAEQYPLIASSEKNVPVFLRTKPKLLTSNKYALDSCDIIKLKNNFNINAKVIEIGISDIKYKNCGDIDGPDRIISKSEVLDITYANGSKESSENINQKKEEKTRERGFQQRKTHPLSIHALIAGICSFTPFIGWIFGILSIIFGSVSLIQIHKNPEKYTGKNISLVGLLLGVAGIMAGVAIVFALIFL